MSFIPLLLAAQGAGGAFDAGPNPYLARNPAINRDTIVFQFAGDLWKVPREGGQANRLTTAPGTETAPSFSPDGRTIAFSGLYDGNGDVFIVPVEGGVPKRLTAHPAYDTVLGFSPDGQSVIFSSSMETVGGMPPRLYTVSINGGMPKAVPLPSGTYASFSGDGAKLAYVPGSKWQHGWKRYRGGQAYKIWIANLSDSKVKEIPRADENNMEPMWVGDSIYYLSDKKGPFGLFRYDIKSGKVSEEVAGSGFDIKSAAATDDAIVYEKFGSLNLFDIKTKTTKRVPIEIRGDFPEVRPKIKDVQGNVQSYSASPTGQRAVVTARGWLFSVPVSKGDTRQLGEEQGVFRRGAVWSPDGRHIAYISDERGTQELALLDLQNNSERFLPLGDAPNYYLTLDWSPDSNKIAYTDHKLGLWVIDLKSGENTKVDAMTYRDPTYQFEPRWSPDSRWVTWVRDLDNHRTVVWVYNLDTKQKSQLTNGLANARKPVFDRDGKHIYFFASTKTGWSSSWLDMSSLTVPNVTSNVYAIVLSKDSPNPLQPESDEEPIKQEPPARPEGGTPAAPPQGAPAPPKPGTPEVKIDLEGIERRIVTLPMPEGIYLNLEAGPAGSFFVLSGSSVASATDFSFNTTLQKFVMKDRRATPFASPVFGMDVSASGSHILITRPGGAAVVPTATPPQPGQGTLNMSGLKVKIDPKAEWKAMFHDIWRNQPIRFYDAGLHGIDAKEMERRYEPFLENIASRSDLNYLFEDMIGELTIGHMWANGGDLPGASGVPGGLLGADYELVGGKYRLKRVYDGETWNPGLVGPLSVPGVNAQAGEYLLEIDGKPLNDAMDIYLFLEGKAGKHVRVKIGPNADGSGSREGIVVPVTSEGQLRVQAWREDNRRKVAELSGGRLGYVHIPDTQLGGWTNFQRYYYSQIDKDGMIIDERFNQGGMISDYIINEMMRPFSGVFTARYGQKDWPTPGAAHFGPKVMIANEFAGSGGDILPWLFKYHKIGPVVGKRTWGGLVAADGFGLIDGGSVNAPDIAFYNPHTGKWDIEGYGVDPDIEVELDPALWRQGRDAQLEKAVAAGMDLLKTAKLPSYKRPPSADKSKVGGRR